MNILFITESYLPKANGMASVVRYLAEGLEKKGYIVSVATQRHNCEDRTEEVIKGVHVYRFDINRSLLKKPIGEVSKFRDFVLNFIADTYIFECIGSLTSDIMFPYLSMIRGKKILHSHGNTFNTMRMFKLCSGLKYTIGNTYNYCKLWYQNQTLFPKGIHEFDACIYLSEIASDKDIIERNGKRTYILHNAADKMFFDYSPTKRIAFDLGIRHRKYMLSVANYTKIKNGIRMINAYFEAKIDNFSLVMIGSSKTEYYYQIKSLVKKLSKQYPMKDVVLLTGVDRQLIPQIVDEATLYLTSSDYEEYSVSLIEAMSRGIPFISTDVGNARILPGGYTVNDRSKMAPAIEKLLADKQLYAEYSAKGRLFALKNCQEDVAVNNLINIINNINI